MFEEPRFFAERVGNKFDINNKKKKKKEKKTKLRQLVSFIKKDNLKEELAAYNSNM